MTATHPVDPGSPTEPTGHRRRWLLLSGVWLLYFAFGLTVAAMAPLVAPIRQALDMGDGAMGSVPGAWQSVGLGTALLRKRGLRSLRALVLVK